MKLKGRLGDWGDPVPISLTLLQSTFLSSGRRILFCLPVPEWPQPHSITVTDTMVASMLGLKISLAVPLGPSPARKNSINIC